MVMRGRNKMYLKHKKVRSLALRIMYDLATRVPQVLLQRVEECEPLARVKLAELMQEPRETVATEQLIESEVVVVDSTDTNSKMYNNRVPQEITIKEEILDDDDDWYHCVNGSVAKLEIKEEMTFEDHNICVDEGLIREDDLIITDSSYDEDSGMSLSEDTCHAVVRCESPMENRSDNSQETLPVYGITKIKREEDDNTMMRRYRRFMRLSSKDPSYMVKFPPSVVRCSKKKECSTCKKKFADELKLAEHMSIHAGTFTCVMCGEVFQCYGSLKGHIRVHLGERPYNCKCCRKSKSNCW